MLGVFQKLNVHSRYICFMGNFHAQIGIRAHIKGICRFSSQVYVRSWFLSSEPIKEKYYNFLFLDQLQN